MQPPSDTCGPDMTCMSHSVSLCVYRSKSGCYTSEWVDQFWSCANRKCVETPSLKLTFYSFVIQLYWNVWICKRRKDKDLVKSYRTPFRKERKNETSEYHRRYLLVYIQNMAAILKAAILEQFFTNYWSKFQLDNSKISRYIWHKTKKNKKQTNKTTPMILNNCFSFVLSDWHFSVFLFKHHLSLISRVMWWELSPL